MLLGYVQKFPNTSMDKIPNQYKLGPGHMLFFKNKLKYLEKRHKLIKKEMQNRGFKINETIDLSIFKKDLINDFKPSSKDKEIIKERLIWKINLKPNYYRYYREKKPARFFIKLIENAR